MRTRHRLHLAALACLIVSLATALVAYLAWPADTPALTTAAGADLAAYAYAGLSGVALIAALVLAGLAARWDPVGASSRCTACWEPVPEALTFCPTCGRREHPADL